MKKVVLLSLASLLVAACASPSAPSTASQGAVGKWVCKAPVLLATANYTGDGMAFIQEFGLMAGRLYEVERISDNQVKGVTRRDTNFTCTRQ